MTTPLLATKLHIPSVRLDPSTGLRTSLVRRHHLLERLNEGPRAGRKLTLVSAPAGFGKTTLVSEWIHGMGAGTRRGAVTAPLQAPVQAPLRVAWLSLDKADNDLTRFLTYLVAALQTAAPDIGAGVLRALHARRPQPPPTESILTALLNEIAAFPDSPAAGSEQGLVLVLDDYHVIDAKPVDDALTFLLEHLSPHVHLVIATREDPALPLPRLRARGHLVELRVQDLRFTPSEAAEFLNRVMGLNLSPEQVASLEARTEGWIAGLQLAALSMRGREDVPGFIRAFAGDNRYIVDYLVEEVLQRQPERVRNFLLQTSILGRLSGPLCDAVTGQKDGRTMLEELERSNLFVVPLDDRRHWYRYHQLFADVLHARLLQEQPQQAPALHQRASEWYEQNGLPADAIRHALAAGDFERAADLVELAWSAMHRSYIQSPTWLGWVRALPDDLVRARPVLSAGYAWALLDGGELEAAGARLRDAERWLDSPADVDERPEAPTGAMVVVDEEQFRVLPVTIAAARAYQAQALGDLPGAVTYAQRVLALLPDGDHHWRSAAASLLGLAYWASGDLEAAHRSFADIMATMRSAGNVADAVSVAYVLADIRMAQGRLHEALHTYQDSLQFAAGHGEPMPLDAADLYRGMGELYCEWGDLEAAARHLLIGAKLGEQGELPDWQRRLRVAQARVKVAQGDLNGALDLLDEAQRLTIRTPLPDVRPIAALKARVWVAQGRLAAALAWARERGLSVNDELSYMREFEHVTLARVLIAQHRSDRRERSLDEAIGLLQRLLAAAEDGERIGSVIEILVLQALAHQALGDIPLALKPLERALALAEPESHVRIFVHEGPPMVALLREAAKRSIAPNYVRQLQASFEVAEGARPVPQPLVEPLTERELDVLRLLGTELKGPEIAHELVISLNTLRTHTKSIYGKLGVHSRRATVRRAEELGLL